MPDQDDIDLPELLNVLIAGNKRAAMRLLSNGVDADTIDTRPWVGNNQTALHYAVDFDDSELIRAIVQQGGQVDARTTNGQTPLWLACNGGFRNSVQTLLEHGANSKVQCFEGYSPEDRVKNSDSTIVQLLRAWGSAD